MSKSEPTTFCHFLPDHTFLTITTTTTPASEHSPRTFVNAEFTWTITSHPGPITWTATLESPSSDAYPIPPTPCSDTFSITAPKPDINPIFTLYCTLTWYFHLLRPPRTQSDPSSPLLRLNALSAPWGTAASSPKPGAPRSPWSVRIDIAADTTLLTSLVTRISDRMGPVQSCVYQSTYWNFKYLSPRPDYQLHSLSLHPSPTQYTTTNNIRHPIRPPLSNISPHTRDIYRRYIPNLNSILTFRLATLDDTRLINTWMNNPRVSAFWGEDGDLTKTRKFLRDGLAKPHSEPVIGSWEKIERGEDGEARESGVTEPFGYFEIYWVKEDILGQYADDVGDWERGVHVLVGEERFRGKERVRAWLGGLVEFCFKDEARTRKVALEPRVDNIKFIKYLLEEGFYKEKEFAFPHKQAALMRIRRDAWEGPSV